MDESILNGGITGLVVMVVYAVYKIVKKSSCSSKCCGMESSVKIRLERNLISPTTSTSTQTSQEEV